MSGIQLHDPRDPRGLGQPGPYPRAHGLPGGATSSNPYGPVAGNPFGFVAGNPYGGAYDCSPTLHLTPSGQTVLAGPDFHQRQGYLPDSRVRVFSNTDKNGANVMSYPYSSGTGGYFYSNYPAHNAVVPLATTSNHYVVPASGSGHHFHPTPGHQNLHGEPTGDWEFASARGTNKAKKGSATALPSQQASHSSAFFGSNDEKEIKLCELEAVLQECAMAKKIEKHIKLTGTRSSLGSDSSTDNLALTPGSTPPAPSTKVTGGFNDSAASTKVTGALNDSAVSDKSSKVRVRVITAPETRTKPATRATYERLLDAFHATTVERIAQIEEPADKLAYLRERKAHAKSLAAAAAVAASGKSTKTGGLSDDDRYEEVPITFTQSEAEARLNRSYDDHPAGAPKPMTSFSLNLGSENQHSIPAAEIPKPKVVAKAAPNIHRQQSVPAAVKEGKIKDANKAQFLLLKKVLLNRLPDIEKAYAEGDTQHQKKVRAAMLTLLDSHLA